MYIVILNSVYAREIINNFIVQTYLCSVQQMQ